MAHKMCTFILNSLSFVADLRCILIQPTWLSEYALNFVKELIPEADII